MGSRSTRSTRSSASKTGSDRREERSMSSRPILDVWRREVPADAGARAIGEEGFRSAAEAPNSAAKWLTNVTKPTITVFRPPQEKNTGAAMIICPGGGYWNLAWDLEGEEVAAWLNNAGITGIVLKYRVPRRPTQP